MRVGSSFGMDRVGHAEEPRRPRRGGGLPGRPAGPRLDGAEVRGSGRRIASAATLTAGSFPGRLGLVVVAAAPAAGLRPARLLARAGCAPAGRCRAARTAGHAGPVAGHDRSRTLAARGDGLGRRCASTARSRPSGAPRRRRSRSACRRRRRSSTSPAACPSPACARSSKPSRTRTARDCAWRTRSPRRRPRPATRDASRSANRRRGRGRRCSWSSRSCWSRR